MQQFFVYYSPGQGTVYGKLTCKQCGRDLVFYSKEAFDIASSMEVRCYNCINGLNEKNGGDEPKWFRICPSCKKTLTYKSSRACKWSNDKNAVCKSCSKRKNVVA